MQSQVEERKQGFPLYIHMFVNINLHNTHLYIRVYYMCTYVCIVCMYYTHTYIVYLCACVYVCIYTHRHTHIYIYILYVCLGVTYYMCRCVFVCVYICVNGYRYKLVKKRLNYEEVVKEWSASPSKRLTPGLCSPIRGVVVDIHLALSLSSDMCVECVYTYIHYIYIT